MRTSWPSINPSTPLVTAAAAAAAATESSRANRQTSSCAALTLWPQCHDLTHIPLLLDKSSSSSFRRSLVRIIYSVLTARPFATLQQSPSKICRGVVLTGLTKLGAAGNRWTTTHTRV